MDKLERIKSFLFGRQKSYQQVFSSEMGKMVLADLAKFCRAHESTFHPDPSVRSQLDGRREVWLRIEQHLELSSEQLWSLYGKHNE